MVLAVTFGEALVSLQSWGGMAVMVVVAATCIVLVHCFAARQSSKMEPTADKDKKRRSKGICPFSADSKFIVESDPDISPAPLDLLESWSDPSHPDFGKPLAARWLDAGISGQDTPGILRAGLKPLRDSKFFLVEEPFRLAEELAMKKGALDTRHSQVFVAEDDDQCLRAQEEVLELFLDYLPKRYPEEYQYDQTTKTLFVKALGTTFQIGRDYQDRPLELCERIVQEDLVLMRPPRPGDTGLDGKPTAQYAMAAAGVVFSFAEIPQKLGQPMEFIHAPVPGYHKDLRKTLDLTFSKLLRTRRPLWRNNWGISPSGHLDHPLYGSTEHHALRTMNGEDTTVADVRSKFLKVEYQTIRRLPTSGYLLFTVRTMADPLSCLDDLPRAAACLARSIRGMSPAMRAYKGIPNDKTCRVVLEYLDGIGGGVEEEEQGSE